MYHPDRFKPLKQFSAGFNSPSHHLKFLIEEPDRLAKFSLTGGNVFFDFSRQRVNETVMNQLNTLAKETKALERFSQMVSGQTVNTTEQRAALHTENRRMTDRIPGPKDGQITKAIAWVKQSVDQFARDVRRKTLNAGRGKSFTDAVVVGIGGSYLGCEFAYEALKQTHDPAIKLHFLSNVDIDNFGQVIKRINPETCLWIVISKSFTTTETMANLAQVSAFLDGHQLSAQEYLVTVTAKGSPGDDPARPVLSCFHMFDYIGGRYSVTSAVGGLPLSLAFGPDVFNDFLEGCHAMDCHAVNCPEAQNIPLTAALLNIWNIHCLGYAAQAIIPYASGLSKLAPHVQQLYMESLGKTVTADGRPLEQPAGCVVFGEPGTNAQHSFFQLAHQGPAFPIEFIAVLKPAFSGHQALSKGVTNHQELWANLIAQTLALATGRDHSDPARRFGGNRPSSVLAIKDLSAQSLGSLLAFYEAKTVFEGFLMGINPFDQFGVELGKVLANDIRKEMAARNAAPNHEFDATGSPGAKAACFYLNLLFNPDQKNR